MNPPRAGSARRQIVGTPIIAIACLSLAALPARAAPPDARLELPAGKPRIERVDPSFSVAESDDESIVHAELLPSGELLLEPRGAGTTRVFLFAPRLVRAIEVAAASPLPAIDPAPAAPCAKAHITPACYAPWRKRLLHLPAADAPALEFELEGQQESLKAAGALLVQAGLGGVTLRLSPFGVKLAGAKDAAEERRALRTIWPALLGPLRIDR